MARSLPMPFTFVARAENGREGWDGIGADLAQQGSEVIVKALA
jgi:hypothetical protein